jgi:hypothetical protein
VNLSFLSWLPSVLLIFNSKPTTHASDFSTILLGSLSAPHARLRFTSKPVLPYLHNGPFSRVKKEPLFFSCFLLVHPVSLREPINIDGLSSKLLSGSI